jgi:hypothetical protein
MRLSGTLFDYSGRLSASAAKESKGRLSRAEVFRDRHSKRDGIVTECIDRDALERDVKHKLNFSIVELRKNLDLCLLSSKCVFCFPPAHWLSSLAALSSLRVKKVMSAYTDDKPFSVDLVAAILRQDPFTDKLYHLGWLNSGFSGTHEYERIPYHCILRYQGYVGTLILALYHVLTVCGRFLSLIASLPGSFFVPSMDIDFAWQ